MYFIPTDEAASVIQYAVSKVVNVYVRNNDTNKYVRVLSFPRIFLFFVRISFSGGNMKHQPTGRRHALGPTGDGGKKLKKEGQREFFVFLTTGLGFLRAQLSLSDWMCELSQYFTDTLLALAQLYRRRI